MQHRMIALLVASLALLPGCLRVTVTMVVDDTGGGDATVILAVDPATTIELAANAGGVAGQTLSDADEEEVCATFRELTRPADLPATATITDYDEAGFCGSLIEFAFADAAELESALASVLGADDAGGIVLAPEGEEWRFTAPLDSLFGALNDATSTFPEPLVNAALANTDISFTLTLPGEAVEGANNADEVTGGTFRWNIDPTNPPAALEARSTTAGGGGGDLLGWMLIGLGVLLAAALVGFLLLRRSRRDDDRAPVGSPSAVGGAAPAAAAGHHVGRDDEGSGWVSPDDGAAAADPTRVEPRWDDERGAWVADHPDGLMIHDPATDDWHPI
ncbi:MAG: hypothetical protein AAGD35_21085 [Actinomycetota bacterium]